MAPAHPAAPLRTASDKGIYTYIAVYSAALYTVILIAPVIGGQLTEQFGLTSAQIGMLFSLELGAFSLATLPAYAWLTRFNLRTATYVFTGVVVTGHLVSGFLDSFALLVIARVVTSLAAGSITVILLTVSGKTTNPSRAFGIFVVCQLVMGALILAVFPTIYAGTDVAAIYWTLAALTLACVPVVRLMDGEILRRGVTSDPEDGPGGKVPMGKLVPGLAAVFLFYLSLSGVWTFIAEISAKAGIDLSSSSIVLSVATVAGIVSALLAAAIGDSTRRRLYLLGGYLIMAASVALLFGTPGLVRFAVAAIAFKFAWTFILPYLLSTLSDASSARQVMNSTNLMIGGGFAAGPHLSGVLIESTEGFVAMLLTALVGVLLSMACVASMYVPRTEGPKEPH